jgi:hypothetical protein
LLPLTLRELQAASNALAGSVGVARTGPGGTTAEEFADLVKRHDARLYAYGIKHFQVLNHGESILVHFTDGSVADVREPQALEALIEDLRNHDRRNRLEQDLDQSRGSKGLMGK